MDDILVCNHVYAGYGRISVLNDLSLQVKGGQILGIIGPNGSGKTTLLNALSGMILPTAGTILYQGKDITRLTPDARCRMGIARIFQVPRPFSRMSVFENVLTAAAFGGGGSKQEAWDRTEKALRFTRLWDKRDQRAGELLLLDRKRLEIARSVSTNPNLLLLDEIAAGLTSAEVQEIMDIAADLKAAGYTLIWIEHIIETMMQATDTLICMAEGKVLLSGTAREVMSSREVEEVYLGKPMEVDG